MTRLLHSILYLTVLMMLFTGMNLHHSLAGAFARGEHIPLIHDLYRFHPRFTVGAISLLITLPLWAHLFTMSINSYGWRKKKLKPHESHLGEIINEPVTLKTSFTVDEAWGTLKQLNGAELRLVDTKPAHWTLMESNDATRSAKLQLDYMRSLGVKPPNLYAREMELDAQVRGAGMSAEIVLTFRAASAMDYDHVKQIVDRTKNALLAGVPL